MKLSTLNEWLTLGANIGVLAGIIFLAVELQQNTKQLQLQSYQSWVEANMQIKSTMADPDHSRTMALGNEDSTKLNPDNWIAFAMTTMSMMQMAQSADYLYRSGALDEELWQAEMNRAAGILTIPGARQWWEAGGKSQLAPSFVTLIESLNSDMATWSWSQDRGFFRDDGLEQSRLD